MKIDTVLKRCAQAAIVATILAGGAAHAADQTLIDAAKKEGRVTWYTSNIIDQLVRPIATAFEKKYGVHVDYVRADASDLVLRIFKEAQGGHPQSDVFDGTTTAVGLKKAGLATKWLPDDAAKLPKQYVDAEGYWTAINLYVLTPAFNTNLIPKGTEPRTFADLLDPKLKGKIVWAFTPSSSAAPGFIGVTLASMGEEKGMDFLKKFAAQRPSSVTASARTVLNQVISGEYALGLQMFNDQSTLSAAQGAPISWVPMDPGMAVLSVTGLTKNAPHPNAGKLLIDYLVSDEGQQFFRKGNYIPSNPAVEPLDPTQRPDGVKFKAVSFTPEQIDAAMPRWVGIYNDLFR